MRRFVLACCLIAASARGALRPMTVDDEFRIATPSEPLISPDGRWVAYGLERISLAENTRTKTVWLVPADGSAAPKEFLRKGDHAPMWAPDSRSLFFVRKGQLFEQRIDGGEAVQRSHFEGEEPWLWQLSRDGTSLLAIRSEAKPDAPGAESDVVFVEEGSNSHWRATWDNVWRCDLRSGTLTRVTDRRWSIAEADLSPDGRRVVVAARPDNGRNTRWKSELFIVDLDSGAVHQLTHNAAPEGTPKWSPDARSIVFNAVRLDRWEWGNGSLWSVDVASGKTRRITGEHAGRFSGTPLFSPDGRTIFSPGGYATARYPVRIDVATGAVAPLMKTDGVAGMGSMSDDRRTFAYVYQDATTPPEVYAGRQRLTDHNAWVREEIALGGVERVSWKSFDGMRIEGLLYLPPPALRPKGPLPTIFNLPCGPGCGWVNSFSAKTQVYAGLGFAQLSVVVRGSSNYDEAFMRALEFNAGVGDRKDLMTGADAMIARGIADPKRLAITGWSYGAILGGYTLTKTTRFRAATLGAMVSDWITDYGSITYYSSERWFIGGNPWSRPERWRELSSLTHADRVRTPTLLHHGDDDTTCAPYQSLVYLVALRRFGTTSRLIRYPGEPHDLSQPAHIRLRDSQDVAWMQWFVRGIRQPGVQDGPWTLQPVRDSRPER